MAGSKARKAAKSVVKNSAKNARKPRKLLSKAGRDAKKTPVVIGAGILAAFRKYMPGSGSNSASRGRKRRRD